MAELEERKVLALENIALALVSIAATMQRRYEQDYPAKKETRDATVTHRQTEEEALREAQGDSNESDAEWIGRHERGFIADQDAPRKKASRSTS